MSSSSSITESESSDSPEIYTSPFPSSKYFFRSFFSVVDKNKLDESSYS